MGDIRGAAISKLADYIYDEFTKVDNIIKVFVANAKNELTSLQNIFTDFAGKPIKDFGELITKFTKWGVEVRNVSKMVNIGTGDLSALFELAKRKSIDIDTLINGLKNFNKFLIEAKDSSSEANKTFQNLQFSKLLK
jgi:hypothetical protein